MSPLRAWPCSLAWHRRRAWPLRCRCRRSTAAGPGRRAGRLTPQCAGIRGARSPAPAGRALLQVPRQHREPKGGLRLVDRAAVLDRGRFRAGRRAGQTGGKLPDPVDRLSRRRADAARRKTERCPDRHADEVGRAGLALARRQVDRGGHGRRQAGAASSLPDHRRAAAVLGVPAGQGRARRRPSRKRPGRAARSTATFWPGWSRPICGMPRRPIGGR